MNVDAVKEGTNLRHEGEWFRVVEISSYLDEVVFKCRSCRTGLPKKLTEKDVRGARGASSRPHAEIDLSALLGQRLKIHLGFGTRLGTISNIEFEQRSVLGVEIELPREITVDGDRIEWKHVRGIDALS